MPNRLMDFDMDEGSLVDKGAHSGAKVLIAKRDPAAADLYAATMHPKKDTKKKRPRRRSATEEGDAGIVRDEDPTPAPTSEDEEPMSDKNKLDREALVAKGLDETTADEIAEYIEGLEGYADELEAKVSKSDTDDEDAPVDETDVEEVIKSLDPKVAELISKQMARADELEQAFQTEVSKREAMEDERLTEEFVTVAKSYRHIPTGTDVETLGGALKAISKSEPEAYETIKKALDAADSAMSETSSIAKAFEEYGAGGGDNTGIGDQAESAARELVSKGEAPDIETARVMVLDQNPEMYDASQTPGR